MKKHFQTIAEFDIAVKAFVDKLENLSREYNRYLASNKIESFNKLAHINRINVRGCIDVFGELEYSTSFQIPEEIKNKIGTDIFYCLFYE